MQQSTKKAGMIKDVINPFIRRNSKAMQLYYQWLGIPVGQSKYYDPEENYRVFVINKSADFTAQYWTS